MDAPTEIPSTEPVYHTVQLVVDRNVTVTDVRHGESITPEVNVPENMQIVGWVDEDGRQVVLEKVHIQENVAYTAALCPMFQSHVPYLFTDEWGFINPEQPLTGADLKAAMKALTPNWTSLCRMAFPDGESDISKSVLAEFLTGLFPQRKLVTVIESLDAGTVSRQEFARIMNILLNRTDEIMTVEDWQSIPKDLDLRCDDAADILKAVLMYHPDPTGEPILEAVLEMRWRPGFHLLDGHLYYADENGVLLRNGQLGTLTFGDDGRYTRDDPELDETVSSLIRAFVSQAPADTQLELLYTAFCYCRDEFYYVKRGNIDYGDTGWEAERAKEMFETGAGNCYSFAAAFCELARGLGYDAHCISGKVLSLSVPHGWCEFEIDGENYFF